MAKYVINGGRRLEGKIRVGGAKNAILPILAAVLLTEKQVVLHDCPDLLDVKKTILILESIGCKVKREGRDLIIDPSTVTSCAIPDCYVREIRSSIIFLGAMLSRAGRARVTYPGGCEIGQRPIDLHLKGLRQLGVLIDESNGYLDCVVPKMEGGVIHLDYPSVGATENIMLAAVKAKGRTVIHNAAKEPEIVDLQNFINAMGGNVRGAGTNTIVVEGVHRGFHEVEYTIIPDRIVAGTYMVAAAITGGDVLIDNVIPEHVQSIIHKLKEVGCTVQIQDSCIRVKSKHRLRAIEHIKTLPYPGFPTDMQAQFTSLLSVARGTSIITETIFENRFRHVPELVRMGANIRIDGQTAIIHGVKALKGANVVAKDLRGGAALVLAGLRAEGQTVVENAFYIDRGYEHLEVALRGIGADIVKSNDG
ncbi:UDP-N-acetylglucosamine 1-carboxyvinyltransferase [Caldicoprobacter guelmensis]|uniref:UDP-N-acetylglucosamine 1-carboxyvinyltransferase n=1 Tax=Caldicoprobacter guelmensis TaxID=1170224 RepID=UPI0019591097|nr:UDP-N-acetylglucosamine 1-carboxyvinyltransferase [Caldicoprobacter guelmensis]MBM7583304.1 UDP-N-acetylglucosamine 1-carboxyvinyltransferase [Caldicoprobacter guelmensis]